MIQKIRDRLKNEAEEEYRIFSSKLLPNTENILGIRLPILRNLAKEIAKGDWRTYLNSAEGEYFEEIMLQGMVIGYNNADIDEKLKYAESFIPKIDNWSVCDSFCSGFKAALKNKEKVWDFIVKYAASDKEFEVRFAVVMLLNYYIDELYIKRALTVLKNIKNDGYYVKMAVAWALSICFIKQREPTLEFLKTCTTLDTFTYNKALQKIIESNAINESTKNMIRSMKRK